MDKHTPLFDAHVAAGAKLVGFAGYALPVHYGSQIEEHHAVRRSAGMFDVSHMTIIDVAGDVAESWLRHLLTNDVAAIANGQAIYSCLCREDGGVVDDLIVYRLSPQRFRLIVNAATHDKDLAWFEGHMQAGVVMTERPEIALIAVQGPDAVRLAQTALDKLGVGLSIRSLARFTALEHGDWFVARTGYTGEDGVELALPAMQATALWQALLALGVQPAGLGARDTLRLEAGMNLYGQDLDEEHTPPESGIGWTVNLSDPGRAFIGREVLEDHKLFGGRFFRLGLVLDGRGVLRSGQNVELAGRTVGKVTSGTFSPTLQQSIGLARVEKRFFDGCDVVVRGKLNPAHVVDVPFVRAGRANNKL